MVRAMHEKPLFSTSAAFYDVDGTLIKTNIVHSFAYYALNQPTPLRSVLKGLQTAASIPFFVVADKVSRKLFNSFIHHEAHFNYRGSRFPGLTSL